jgi:hypothetical protein
MEEKQGSKESQERKIVTVGISQEVGLSVIMLDFIFTSCFVVIILITLHCKRI